ncbi:hypothetical protein SKAU_G00352390 [Synaphobranchus kaupii]|uniref:Uncharacterized protein n=1 Tax=Synaphobranchus kaupii TaxID=118154 RepID=A0A9Q1IIA6_SYNKA|nr:hypothetical protein SKAU_G00352390 [Synaphobranchus kaupii]
MGQDVNSHGEFGPSLGYRGHYNGSLFASPWPPELSSLSTAPSSATFELYPIIAAAALWGKEWSRKVILIHSDNIAVVHIINKYLIPQYQQSILSALAPSTLSSSWTSWKCFQNFHSIHHLPFPTLNLLTISSFITYSSTASSLCTSPIQAYLAGINHFKLLTESPCPAINHSQVSLRLKDIVPRVLGNRHHGHLEFLQPRSRLAIPEIPSPIPTRRPTSCPEFLGKKSSWSYGVPPTPITAGPDITVVRSSSDTVHGWLSLRL